MRAMKTSEEAERKSRDIPATEFCRWPIGENLWYQQESLDEHSHYHINPILHLTGTAIKHLCDRASLDLASHPFSCARNSHYI